jgi:Zn-dependent M28 family amino/carboxypeptidase
MIHRSLADQLLEPSGKNLKDLQMKIDTGFAPQSFVLDGTGLRIELQMKHTELQVPNVFGMIEGSDPELKDEMVLYLAHYDHVGTDGQGGIFNGADDNASGSVGLIEIAEAFMTMKKPPKRSVGFLWVSAEEIGLFGSKYFADHPLIPIDRIETAINLDMIGRTKSEEDVNSNRRGLTIVGGDTVKVIGGMQSTLLMDINKEVLEEMGMVGNYEYNDLNHPDRYFFRSDHISFARKDIPVLFYSTGTHRDYHMVTDTEDKIDYRKFEEMVRMSFKVGYRVAQYEGPIEVDNPMSGWDN